MTVLHISRSQDLHPSLTFTSNHCATPQDCHMFPYLCNPLWQQAIWEVEDERPVQQKANSASWQLRSTSLSHSEVQANTTLVKATPCTCNQMQSDAIRCNQMQSDAIRCNQMQSGAIRCNQMQSDAIPQFCRFLQSVKFQSVQMQK